MIQLDTECWRVTKSGQYMLIKVDSGWQSYVVFFKYMIISNLFGIHLEIIYTKYIF